MKRGGGGTRQCEGGGGGGSNFKSEGGGGSPHHWPDFLLFYVGRGGGLFVFLPFLLFCQEGGGLANVRGGAHIIVILV